MTTINQLLETYGFALATWLLVLSGYERFRAPKELALKKWIIIVIIVTFILSIPRFVVAALINGFIVSPMPEEDTRTMVQVINLIYDLFITLVIPFILLTYFYIRVLIKHNSREDSDGLNDNMRKEERKLTKAWIKTVTIVLVYLFIDICFEVDLKAGDHCKDACWFFRKLLYLLYNAVICFIYASFATYLCKAPDEEIKRM